MKKIILGGFLFYVSSALFSMQTQIDLDFVQEDTALHVAVINENLIELKTLICQGVDPNVKNKDGDTPLHLASRNGYDDLVSALLSRRAVNINAKNNAENTPMHLAIHHGYQTIVSLLIQKGAAINLQDAFGQTPFLLAVNYYCSSRNPKHKWIIDLLINNNANINIPNNSGDTPLHIASFCGEVKLAKKLIAYGADINAKNNLNQTPLCIQFKNNNQIICKAIASESHTHTKSVKIAPV